MSIGDELNELRKVLAEPYVGFPGESAALADLDRPVRLYPDAARGILAAIDAGQTRTS